MYDKDSIKGLVDRNMELKKEIEALKADKRLLNFEIEVLKNRINNVDKEKEEKKELNNTTNTIWWL